MAAAPLLGDRSRASTDERLFSPSAAADPSYSSIEPPQMATPTPGCGFRQRKRNDAAKKNKNSISNNPNKKRILDRSGFFSQSNGTWLIQRTGGAWLYAPFYWDDWFHSLLNAPTRRIFACLFLLWVSTIYIFGLIFWAISRQPTDNVTNDDEGGNCNLNFENKLEGEPIRFRASPSKSNPLLNNTAFYLSLSTMTTIGYGVSVSERSGGEFVTEKCEATNPLLLE